MDKNFMRELKNTCSGVTVYKTVKVQNCLENDTKIQSTLHTFATVYNHWCLHNVYENVYENVDRNPTALWAMLSTYNAKYYEKYS